MNRLLKFIKGLNATDFVVIIFCQFLSILNFIFYNKIETWYLNVLMNFGITAYVIFIAYTDNKKYNVFWRQLHYWYLVPLILLYFKELYLMVDPIRGVIFDDWLIKADRFIFGADPTHSLMKIANPYLTELLQIVYGTFYFLPIILGISLTINGKSEELDYSAFIIVYGFILSYIGYILFPAIGPRFTLHDFSRNNFEMPGLFMTDFLREIVNSGESIPKGTINPAAVVQRDAFPSGHTQMTLLVMYLSVKFKSRTKYFLIPNGLLLIFSTVYLRYHYVTDLIGGFVFMLLTLWSGKYIYKYWSDARNNF
jgi:membrane-associated phospholipid phosphatase